MRRNREWWARLDADERSLLVALERASGKYGSDFNLPEGYSGCSLCGYPTSGDLCSACLGDLIRLINKGNGESPTEPSNK